MVAHVDPHIDVVVVKDNGHAIMDLIHVDVGGGGDDRARRQRCYVAQRRGVTPVFVESGEEHGLTVSASEVVGLFGATDTVIPFVESVDGDDARSLREGATERRLFCHSLCASVKESVANGGVLGPTWHEPPPVAIEHASLVSINDTEETTLWSDVPTGVPVGLDARGEDGVEEPRKSSGWGEEGNATAHRHSVCLENKPLAHVTVNHYSYERMFAFSPNRPTLPRELVATLRPVTLAKSRMLPLGEPWSALVPSGGLRRGSTVVVQAPPGRGGLSLALSLLTESSARGHWAAVVGVDDPGVVAIADLGVDLRRVLFVPRPRGAWAESAADLLDGVDLLIVRPPSRASHGAARRLVDRVRERGTVLIVLAELNAPWPLPADLSFDIIQAQWATSSRLDARYLTVRVAGRGEAARGAEHVVVLPNRRGRAEAG